MIAPHRQVIFELLEDRTLFANPSISSAYPANNATNVNRDQFIVLGVNLVGPGTGINGSTLIANTDVNLFRTSDHQAVAHTDNTDGAGANIVIKPNALLGSTTNYTLQLTSGVKDVAGNTLVPLSMTFTTGTGAAH